MWDDMYRGTVKACWPLNERRRDWPDSKKNIDALKKRTSWWLERFIRMKQRVLEVAGFPDEMKQIQTTVYRLPCAGFAEKTVRSPILRAGALEEYGVADARRLPAGPGDRGADFLKDP